jgi:hypothetical protein
MVAELLKTLHTWLDPVTPVLGLLVSLGLSCFTRCVLHKVHIKPTPPIGISQRQLNDALLIDREDPSTGFLGFLETIVFFTAFYLKESAIIAAGWLTFKVAAKWASWQHVVKIPEKDFLSHDPLENIRVRNEWASWLLSRFLLGTLYNVICGLVGASISKILS